jgi:hypothetical protein
VKQCKGNAEYGEVESTSQMSSAKSDTNSTMASSHRSSRQFHQDQKLDTKDAQEADSQSDKKYEIISKLFPMLSATNVKNILSINDNDISMTIDFILSKNLNDSRNSVSMVSSSMMLRPGFFGNALHSNIYGSNAMIGRLRAFPNCTAADNFRFPMTTVFNSLPYSMYEIPGTHSEDRNKRSASARETNVKHDSISG